MLMTNVGKMCLKKFLVIAKEFNEVVLDQILNGDLSPDGLEVPFGG